MMKFIFLSISIISFTRGMLQLDSVHSQSMSNETDTLNASDDIDDIENEVHDALAQQLYAFIDHFKQDDPVGLPKSAIEIPDPFMLPDVTTDVGVATFTMASAEAHGVSQFKIINISIELDKKMEASCKLSFDRLFMKGNYTLKPKIGSSDKGPMTVTIEKFEAFGNINFGVEKDGKVKTKDVDIDLELKKMNVQFEKGGWLVKMAQSFINSGKFFNNIKPKIITDAKVMLKKKIDLQLDEVFENITKMPNSINAVDFAIAEARKIVRNGYDPYNINDYETSGVFGVKLYDMVINGISSFYRVGDIKVTMENGNVNVDLEIGTQELLGKATWEVSIARGMISRAGKIQFTVQYLKTRLQFTQPIDLSKRLKIKDLQIDLGNIQILTTGMGTFDYLTEFLVNTIPNLLRYPIIDSIERPLMHRIQEFTDRIDAEEMIKEKVKEFSQGGQLNLDRIKNEL